jgi:hypothetical protein
MIQEPTWPGITLFAVVPSNTTVFDSAVRQIYVGTAGDVAVVTEDGVSVVFKNVPAGATIGPFFIKKVNATLTTASNLIAFV